uniref:Putative geraniol synthase n=1 Tax=Davidia involucrata TaxID=16924 RepID=A0A5B7BIG7_DAVIN
MVESFQAEANWYNSGYVPSLEEYIENGVTTAGTYMALVHLFFLIGQGITEETVGLLDPYPNFFSSSGTILRLWDDLGTAMVSTKILTFTCPSYISFLLAWGAAENLT